MNTTTVAILGAGGRMGGALIRCIRQVQGVRLGVAIEQAGHAALGRDAGLQAGDGELGVAITDRLDDLALAEVTVDFTFHSAAPVNARAVVNAGKALVLGTTGLSEREADEIQDCARRIPIVWAPNMSLGVNLLFALVEQAAAALDLSYDIEVVEMHHRLKKDAPSGTALGLAEAAARGRGNRLKDVVRHGREGLLGERPAGEIGVHALRGGDIIGDHSVSFSAVGETVTLSHRATTRDTFALGALRAARWVAGKPAGLYDMRDVLGLRRT